MKLNHKVIFSLLIIFSLNTTFLKSREYRALRCDNYIPSFDTIAAIAMGYILADKVINPYIEYLMVKYGRGIHAFGAYHRLLKRYGAENLKEWGLKKPELKQT